MSVTEQLARFAIESGPQILTEEVAASAATREEAADIFAASVLAANPGGAAEEAHLSQLGRLLNLDPDLEQFIRRRDVAEQ